MLPHALSHEVAGKCVVCNAEVKGPSYRVVGLGTICMRCGLEPIGCASCGTKVKRMTVTYFKGRPLCLICYAREREATAKRLSKNIEGSDVEEVVRVAIKERPEGYLLVGVRLAQNSKRSWIAEYEREDVFSMRCS